MLLDAPFVRKPLSAQIALVRSLMGCHVFSQLRFSATVSFADMTYRRVNWQFHQLDEFLFDVVFRTEGVFFLKSAENLFIL